MQLLKKLLILFLSFAIITWAQGNSFDTVQAGSEVQLTATMEKSN
jgi:hypothetical protein